ncbi:hypothetical protein AB0N31_26360 [Streptomyces sp. NPDC051051]|uniref:hypothetical protein n=1 Tax=Streptomyces sp. NPDC051051 TaxID=3155666 RepID=UPI00341953A5
MTLGRAVTITPDNFRQIWERLTPHLPPYLRTVENDPSGWGLRFTFAEFTGREEEPAKPASFYDDPRLRLVRESEDPAEYRLRRAAGQMLSDLYDAARKQWKIAAYVAALRDVVHNAPARWAAYERAATVLESAYSYLRTPQASREWPSAISRLIDAQEHTLTAAEAFDQRAADIAAVHEQHLYADLGHVAALTEAGYPQAKDWHIGDGFGGYFTGGLQDRVRDLIEQQAAHVAKVDRPSGAAC